MNQTIFSMLGALGAGLAIAACSESGSAVGSGNSNEPSAHPSFDLSTKRIFFGHQSVGENLLDGIEDLRNEGSVRLRIAEVEGALGIGLGTLGHAAIPHNGAPFAKIESFRKAFEGTGVPPDVALMKLCYVDFDESTDVDALFERYRRTLTELRKRFPGTTFVHVTTPLTARGGVLKSLAKAALGRPSATDLNGVRERYNVRIRETFEGKEPVFDLARFESTRPDGTRAYSYKGSHTVPELVPSYSDDGSHLNTIGRKMIARNLTAFLASLQTDGPREAEGTSE